MTTTDRDLTEQIEAAIQQATDDGASKTQDYAAAVLPIVDAAVKRGQAEALRKAADGLRTGMWPLSDHSGVRAAARELDYRADLIEKETPDEQ